MNSQTPHSDQVTAIVLAAGRGTRMKADQAKNKVVFALNHQPMIRYTIDTLKQSGVDKIIVVVGHAKESVMAELGDSVTYAHQDNPQGTGHAVKVALELLPATARQVLIMYGDDSAFYTPNLINQLIALHTSHQNKLTLVSIHKSDPVGLGRILRNQSGDLMGIVEEKVADTTQKQITEINTGLYCFESDFLIQAVNQLQPNPISKEYYLTDTVDYACQSHQRAEALLWQDQSIWHGINTPDQLQAAEMRMKQKNGVQ